MPIYDWQGGLVWMRMEAEAEGDLVRRYINALGGGHATLVRAADAARATTPAFEPQPAAVAVLSARVKEKFDPEGIFNPGKMGHEEDCLMQTNFTLAQLADPHVAESEAILRKCVHCGFCTATCPTYVTLGNELDSPRGRIYLIKDMLENGRPADDEVVDPYRPLSLLPCLHDHLSVRRQLHAPGRSRPHPYRGDLQATADGPADAQRAGRGSALSRSLPAGAQGGPLRAAVRALMKRIPALKPFGAMLDLAPRSHPGAVAFRQARTA